MPHKFSLNDLVLYIETNFLGRNKKLSPKWLGPADIIKLSDTNVTLKLKNGKEKQFNLLRIKPFQMKKLHQEFNYDTEEEDFSEDKSDTMPN